MSLNANSVANSIFDFQKFKKKYNCIRVCDLQNTFQCWTDVWKDLGPVTGQLVAGISRRRLSHFRRSREFSSPEQGFTHNFRGHLSGRKVNANPTVDSVPSVRDYVTCTYSSAHT